MSSVAEKTEQAAVSPKKAVESNAIEDTVSATASSAVAVVRYMECVEGGSDKFYEVTQTGDKVVTRYGRCGATGARAEKAFASVEEATKFADKTCTGKLKKGYHIAVPGRVAGSFNKRKADESMASSERAEEENGRIAN